MIFGKTHSHGGFLLEEVFVLNDKKINVLLVDDEEALLDSMRRRLQFRDFNVIAASSGKKALEIARENPVDVAIVDIKMPGMSGRDVLLALKEEYPWVEVIILTGHGSFSPEEEGIAEKMHSCLGKPCDLATLQQVLTDAYKKTVMNRREIAPQEMDAMLNSAEKKSPDAVLKQLKELDVDR